MKRREPMTPERMVWMRRNGWLPREPVRRDPRPELDVMTPWLPPWKPEEGERITWSLDQLTWDYAALDELKPDFDIIVAQADKAGYSFSLNQLPSERRYYIAKGLLTLFFTCRARYDGMYALRTVTEMVDELARCFVADIADDPAAQQPGIPLGAVIGSLDTCTAQRFADLAAMFEQGHLAVLFSMGGRMYLPDDPEPVVDDDPFAP